MPHVLGLAGVFALSFAAVFFRLAHVSPTTAVVFRAIYAVPLLFVVHRATRQTGDARGLAARLTAAASGVLLALDLVFWHIGIDLVGVGLATVAASVQVALVAGVGWTRDGERPTLFGAAVIVAVLVGIVLASGLSGAAAYGSAPGKGVAVSVLAGVCYAGFLVVFRDSNRRGTHPVAALLDATIGMGAGGLVCAAFDPGFTVALPWPALGWLAVLAVTVQVVGWLAIAGALPKLPAIETSVLLVGQPVLSVAWGIWLFEERLSLIQWAGSALVLGGIAALSARGAVRPPTRELWRERP